MSKEKDDRYIPMLIGLSDGLIIPMATTAALWYAAIDQHLLIQIGLVVTIAAAIIMGLGGFLTQNKRANHITPGSAEEKEKMQRFFTHIGMNEEMQRIAFEELDKDAKEWAIQMPDIQLEHHQSSSAWGTATYISIAYCIGGAVPLLPYLFLESNTAFIISASLTGCCLLVFGYGKKKLLGEKPVVGAIRSLLVGGLSVAAAIFITYLLIKAQA